jgi:hypothetical protein
MGLFDWYPFLRRKGYNPMQLYLTIVSSLNTSGRRRFDTLANCHRVIQHAYSTKSGDEAHRMLEQDIERFGNALNMDVYIDGPQAEEKRFAAASRETNREKALERAEAGLATLETRLSDNSRIRKSHHTTVRAAFSTSFYWSLASRIQFAEYMRSRGWTVKSCRTEADVAIAQDAQPNDIIVSTDSDMFAYSSIVTIWRPVSKLVILVYKVPDVLLTLGITRSQLTALAVVSRNDYQRNIQSLGLATNYGVIKKITRSTGNTIIDMVVFLSCFGIHVLMALSFLVVAP